MLDSTLKIIFAGSIALGGLAGVISVLITGMIQATDPITVLALAAVPGQAMIAGLVYFLGYRNGTRYTLQQQAKTQEDIS